MIRALKTIQKHLVRLQRAKFCSANNPNNGADKPVEGTAEVTKEPQQQQSAEKHQNKQQSQQQFQKKQFGSSGDHQKQKQGTQHAQNQQTNLQGSKINAGTSQDVKGSIDKSVQEFAQQFKLSLNETKKVKEGNKETFKVKGDRKQISLKSANLLQQLKPTQEPLNRKNIPSIPIAQQVYADRIKKYALRISDTKRIKEHFKSEEGVNFNYVEPRNLEILNSHIHRQSEEMETFIATYLGVNETLSKGEQLDDWRQQQALDNIDFTPETMGKPEVFYPGSPKGRHPEDDPESYIQWYDRNCPIPYRPMMDQMIQISEMKITDNNMPQFIKKWIQDVQEDEQDDSKNKEDDEKDKDSDTDALESEDDDGTFGEGSTGAKRQEDFEAQLSTVVGGGQGVFFYRSGTLPRLNADNSSLWYLNQNEELSEDTSPEEQIVNCEGNITFHSGLESYEIPAYPEKMPHYVSHYQIPYADRWSVFRQFPNMYHWWKNFITEHKRLSDQPLVAYQYQGLPSVYTYYHTLPEFARNSLVVQNVARCLEFRHHELSHSQKMMALNFAAKFTLPIDDLIAHAATQMIVSNKHFLTAKEEDKLKTVKQFYYEADTESWAIHLAQEEHTIEQVENPPAPKKLVPEEIEEELCQLPLEFYDNEDGFWDEFIKEKYNRNHRAYPTTQSRPFFKH